MSPLDRLKRYQAEHAELSWHSPGHAEKAADLTLALAVVEAARLARVDLAALIPEPDFPHTKDWPVKNQGDAECLQTAFIELTNALTALTTPTP